MDKPSVNTTEAARRAGTSTDTIRRWCRLGYLHPIRVGVGRRYRIDAVELAAVIDGTVSSSSGSGAQGRNAVDSSFEQGDVHDADAGVVETVEP